MVANIEFRSLVTEVIPILQKVMSNVQFSTGTQKQKLNGHILAKPSTKPNKSPHSKCVTI
jgi:hypothetical protein